MLSLQLAKNRPKLVKVRPAASSIQKGVLEKAAKLPRPSGNRKVSQLRNEARIQTTRLQQKRPNKASFGDAVAFASTSAKGASHKRKKLGGTVQKLGEGKRMKIPHGRGARQFASKWKTK